MKVLKPVELADAVYVLHCFQKKTAKTGRPDQDLAIKRYRSLLKELDQ
jgi:phage-related protein